MGLMQIMPATWADLRRRYQLGADPFDPRGNILAGAAYLRALRDRFGTGRIPRPPTMPVRRAMKPIAWRAGRYTTRRAFTWPSSRGLLPNLPVDPGLMVAAMPEAWRLSRLFVGDSPAPQSQAAKISNGMTLRTPSVTATTSEMAAVMALAPHADGLFVAVGPGASP